MTAHPAVNRFVESFKRDESLVASPAWLKSMRQEGLERFARKGFPTIHDEDWKYLRFSGLLEASLSEPATQLPSVTRSSLNGALGSSRLHLVFINGIFSSELSSTKVLPRGATICALEEAAANNPDLIQSHLGHLSSPQENPFADLNTAFIRGGAFVHLNKNVILEEPLTLLFLSTPGGQAAYPRNLIIAESAAQGKIVEIYEGHDGTPSFTDAVTEFFLADGAVVDHVKVQKEGNQGYHVASLNVNQGSSSAFSSLSFSLGGILSRDTVSVTLDGEGADCTLNGLYLGRDTRQVDHHTRIDHLKPHGTSRTLHKGIVGDKARGIFNGKVIVHPNAQKTSAEQQNKNLLLSEEAEINPKPQLEIFADDVKCSHGSTVGQLDEKSIFYLRSRGIGETEARHLLTHAFAREVVENIKTLEIRERVDLWVTQELSRTLGKGNS